MESIFPSWRCLLPHVFIEFPKFCVQTCGTYNPRLPFSLQPEARPKRRHPVVGLPRTKTTQVWTLYESLSLNSLRLTDSAISDSSKHSPKSQLHPISIRPNRRAYQRLKTLTVSKNPRHRVEVFKQVNESTAQTMSTKGLIFTEWFRLVISAKSRNLVITGGRVAWWKGRRKAHRRLLLLYCEFVDILLTGQLASTVCYIYDGERVYMNTLLTRLYLWLILIRYDTVFLIATISHSRDASMKNA